MITHSEAESNNSNEAFFLEDISPNKVQENHKRPPFKKKKKCKEKEDTTQIPEYILVSVKLGLVEPKFVKTD